MSFAQHERGIHVVSGHHMEARSVDRELPGLEWSASRAASGPDRGRTPEPGQPAGAPATWNSKKSPKRGRKSRYNLTR